MSTRATTALRLRIDAPLYRNGYALVASSAVTSGLGLAFWLVAARSYSAADLGRAAALLSAMLLIADIAQLNLKGALTRFLPVAGGQGTTLVIRAYAFSATLAGLLAGAFVLSAGTLSAELAPLLAAPATGVWFVISAMAWTIFVLQDAVLTGIRRAPLVLTENLAYSVAKLGLLLLLAAATPALGVFLSWTIPVLVAVAVVNVLVFRRLLAIHTASHPGRRRPASLLGYLAGDTIGYAIWAGTTGVVPLVVLHVEGAEASAGYFVAWSIAYGLYLVCSGLGQSLLVEASHAPAHAGELARETLRESLRIVVPATVAVVLIAPALMSLLGDAYEQYTDTLRLLAGSAIPYAVVSVHANLARVRRQMGKLITIYASLAVIVLGAGTPLLSAFGRDGMAGAWLAGQLLVAGWLLLAPRVPAVGPLWSWRLRPLARVAGGLRVVTRPPTGGGARVFGLGFGRDDIAAYAHVARDERGDALIERRRTALARLPSSQVVPETLFGGRLRGRRFEVERALPGVPAARALAEGLPIESLLAGTFAALAPVHGHGVEQVVGEELLQELVDRPASILEAHTPARDRPTLAALRRELREGLADRRLVVCPTHGDLWPGNVLLGPGGEVTGIVDWESASPAGLAGVDRVHLMLTSRALATGRELGAVVADILRRPAPVAALDPDLLPMRTQILLAWLLHVSGNLAKSDRYRRSPLWRRANVRPVLDVVGRQADAAGRMPAAARAESRTVPAWSGPVLGAIGLVVWLVSLSVVRPDRMGDLGLASVLPPTAALGLFAGAAGLALTIAKGRWRSATAMTFGLVFALHAAAPLIYDSLRYSWAYKHVGIVDFIQRTGSVDRATDVLPVYHQWPGFFGADALLTSVAGLPDALAQATWAPLVFALLNLAALVFVLSGFTPDRRVIAIAAVLFASAGWVGQEYFSPQAFAFFCWLMVLGFGVRDQTLPALAMTAAVVVAHPLTGVMTTISLVALALAGHRTRALAVMAALITVAWDLGFAGDFVRAELAGVIDSIALPWSTAGANLTSAATLSEGQQIVAAAGRAIVLAMVALAALGVLRAHRSGTLRKAPALLAVAPVALFGAGDYDGEMVFRVYLFALPFLAFLAAQAFRSSTRSHAALGVVTAALLCAFVLAHFGKDHQYAFTSGEVAAGRFVSEHSTPGTLVIEGTPNYPSRFENYEQVVHVPISREPETTQDRVFSNPAGTLSDWLGAPDVPAGFVVLTRSQFVEARETGAAPPGALEAVARALLRSPRFAVAFRNRDAIVLELSKAAR